MNNTNKNSCERKVFSERDKLLLISLVDSYKHILENKKTDATNVEKKNGAWKEITDLYNANDVCPRTDKQLRKLRENLKQRTRKIDSEMRKDSQLQSERNASQAFIEVTDAQSNMGDIDQDKPEIKKKQDTTKAKKSMVNGQPNGNNTSENFITPQKKRKRPSVCGTIQQEHP
ncbi:unnamed protein product [Acanthoscelides obtectus]|uniref:Regulatory protein zeste n=1 Tax=Acanthoscelides obtectus TaxID=200917 RepID=A0A9P0PC71_ACAOB|nr:unnamed protein product [Acanthoscelides obtectus]CAK1674803.1 Myb/SANT-like DNA-binding domain-containing protein 3 [Acanthoscelides obtectus]